MNDSAHPQLDRFARLEVAGDVMIASPYGDIAGHQDDIVFGMEQLLGEMERNGQKLLVIDFAECEFFGTMFLGSLVKVWKRISQRGGRLALCHLSPKVLEVLQLTKLHLIWPVHGGREDALRAIRG